LIGGLRNVAIQREGLLLSRVICLIIFASLDVPHRCGPEPTFSAENIGRHLLAIFCSSRMMSINIPGRITFVTKGDRGTFHKAGHHG
jgi:hypothetical protein